MKFDLGGVGCGGPRLTVNLVPPADILHELRDVDGYIHADGSVDEFFLSHTLEHIPIGDYRKFLRDLKRKLKPGGRLLIRHTDAAAAIRQWIAGDLSFRAMKKVIFPPEEKVVPNALMAHQNMWSPEDLAHDLECLGFVARIWDGGHWPYDLHDELDPESTRPFQGVPIRNLLVEAIKPDQPIVPNVIHMIFGLAPDFGGRPFSFIHYLNVKAALEVNRPDVLNLYFCHEPQTTWWKRAVELPRVRLRQVSLPTSPDGRDLKHYAHRAGMLRLNLLAEYGGVYLDSDVFCVRPLTPLRYAPCTLGTQGPENLCDAVILARAGAPFIKHWATFYREFSPGLQERNEIWDQMAVNKPTELARRFPDLVQVASGHSFHYPLWTDIHRILQVPAEPDPFPEAYCHHLWEAASWNLMKDLTPEALAGSNSYFAALARRHL
jgi:hypothetical protein